MRVQKLSSFVLVAVTFLSLASARAQETPDGCSFAGAGAAITRFPTSLVNHGDKICYTIQYNNGKAGINCELRQFDADLFMPDGSSIPLLRDATILSGTGVTCPSADPRCVTPSNCTIPGRSGYEYIVNHMDEVGSFAGCPPKFGTGSGRVVAYTYGEGDSLTFPPDFANACATANNFVAHGACCEPCSGTCIDEVTANECPAPSVFTQGASCSNAPACLVTCPGPIPPCEAGQVCNPSTGLCINLPDAPLSTPCVSDSNICTTDHCDGKGRCVRLSDSCDDPDFCDDENVCTTDECDIDFPECCENTPITCPPEQCRRNTGCDPEDGCLYVFDCRAPGKSCCPKGGPCSTPFCDPKSGQCSLIPDCREDVHCNDNNPCTVDNCTAEGCCENTPLCPGDTLCCAIDPNVCDDQNVCTHNVCVEGECCDNPPITCEPRPCMRITGCHPVNGCQYVFDCREGDGCCPGGQCATASCSPDTGECSLIPDCQTDHDCKDDDECTVDVCTDLGCCEHRPRVCNDDNACTTDSCEPDKGCVYTPDCESDHDCKDDDECTIDVCTDLGCCEHRPRVCNDDNTCTTDTCEPDKGCVYTPGCLSNADCNDNNACTDNVCSALGCCQYPPKVCNDNNSCTADSCDPATGCVYTPRCDSSHDCKDNNACTQDICNAQGCCENPPLVCDDQNVCTIDSCNPTSGCGHSPRVCNDNNSCTTDTCDPVTGCVYSPGCDSSHDCKDNNACTIDICNAQGCCEHPPLVCNDHNDCTTDSCNPTSGCGFEPECRSDSECGSVSKPCMEARCVEGCCVTESVPCCGNGYVDPGETCDPPGSTQSNGKHCRSNCTYCGDGIVNGGEVCDDGNNNNADTCNNKCDRVEQPCDDGDPCTEDVCVCANNHHDDDDDGGDDDDDGDWDDDDDDGHSAAGKTPIPDRSTQVKQSRQVSSGSSTMSSSNNDDDDDHGDDDDDHRDDDDDGDHDGDDDDDDVVGTPCNCPPAACDDNAATGDHDDDDDGDDDDHGDDDDDDSQGNTCVCVHRPLCDDGNACTQDVCLGDGTCRHDPVVCADNNECTSDWCHPDHGCKHTPECSSDNDCGSVAKPCAGTRCVGGCCVEQSDECCGNGTEEEGETCDPPGSMQSNGKTCRSNCTYCGDGIRNSDEQCDDGNSNNSDSCTNKCTSNSSATEGCTPGYWKQSQHFDDWTNYQPSNSFDTVFGVHSNFAANTLLEALNQGGGGEMGLGRHAVAALLNSTHPEVDYAYTTSQVIGGVKWAYTTGYFETIKNILAEENERVCPLD